MLEMRKLFLLSVAFALSLATVPSCFAANLVVNGDFATALGDKWEMVHLDETDTRIWHRFSGTEGYPAGSLMLERSVSPGQSTDGHRFLQWVPVEPNVSYQVRGQWKGDLSDGAQGGNWAEVYIGFTADPNIGQANWGQFRRYRKSWDGVNNINVSANGQWEWENITASPSGTPPAAFTSQGSHNYMLLAFNLGGERLEPSSAQPYVYIDNIVVIACTEWLAGDVNQDCQVNFKDLGIMTSQWLLCNLDPPSACW